MYSEGICGADEPWDFSAGLLQGAGQAGSLGWPGRWLWAPLGITCPKSGWKSEG